MHKVVQKLLAGVAAAAAAVLNTNYSTLSPCRCCRCCQLTNDSSDSSHDVTICCIRQVRSPALALSMPAGPRSGCIE